MELEKSFEQQLDRLYDTVICTPEKQIERIIYKQLDRCGLMYRTFSRTKEKMSVKSKIQRKRSVYLEKGKKMQDIVGIRIVLYFRDDIDVCIDILKNLFEVDSCEYDMPDAETFRPQRINYVFKIPENIMKIPIDISEDCLVDNTFEVQIRTIFSEGWHEVEHDIRYKYSNEWNTVAYLSRELNGILAVLEMCDHNIMSICERMAYKKYKEKEWDSMIRNKFRLRFLRKTLSEDLCKILSDNAELAKALYRYERGRLIYFLADNNVPINCDNVIYIVNALHLHDEKIKSLTPLPIIEKCSNYSKAVRHKI